MQSEKQIEAAARAICAAKGLNPDCLHQINVFDGKEHFDSEDDRGRRYVIGWRLQEKFARAALEAALSAAEPRGYLVHDKDNPDGRYFNQKPSISDDDMSEYEIWIEPLYAAPPAPTVAVKAFETNKEMIEAFGVDRIREGSRMCFEADGTDTWENYYEVPFHALDRIRSALSAQVQDVAPLQNVRGEVTHEGICSTHEGGPCNCDWSAADQDEPHPDDIAVGRFAAAMKAKLAKKRDEGRGGWEDKDDCSHIFLSQLLREHVEKGDPVDVGNLAMMLHQRGERIASLLETLQGE